MRRLLRSGYGWAFAVSGALAGTVAWLLGPRATLALGTGFVLTVALLFTQWLRTRLRRAGDELAEVRGPLLAADLGGLEHRVTAALVNHRELAGWRRQWSTDLERLRTQLSAVERRAVLASHQEAVQLQALQNLYAMVPVGRRMPPLDGGWAVSPDFMLLFLSLVQEHRPATIIELGSGASTVWSALLVREHGIESRIVSVDHDLTYGEITRERLTALGLEKQVELRHAPLVDLELDGESYPWYDRVAFLDVDSCDLLVVDGPPGKVRPKARYPALPVLGDRMPLGAQVLLDDYRRSEEREMVAQWLAALPGWQVREFRYEKGAALLTRTA